MYYKNVNVKIRITNESKNLIGKIQKSFPWAWWQEVGTFVVKIGENCLIDCPLSKGNQAATPKIERPNGNKT